jgi:hypothetical protein
MQEYIESVLRACGTDLTYAGIPYQLYSYLGLGRSKQLSLHSFFCVGTSIKTQPQPQTQTSPPWQASPPSSGANLLVKPISAHGGCKQGVGQGRG